MQCNLELNGIFPDRNILDHELPERTDLLFSDFSFIYKCYEMYLDEQRCRLMQVSFFIFLNTSFVIMY